MKTSLPGLPGVLAMGVSASVHLPFEAASPGPAFELPTDTQPATGLETRLCRYGSSILLEIPKPPSVEYVRCRMPGRISC